MKKLSILALALAVLVTVGFAPVMQGVQRFKTIIAETVRSDDITVNDDLVVTDDTTMTGDLTVSGALSAPALTIGSDYALSNSASGIGWECGDVNFTGTTTVDATGLTTATYAVAGMNTDPTSAEEAFVTNTQPTTTTFVIKAWKTTSDVTGTIAYAAGDSAVDATWCAMGNK